MRTLIRWTTVSSALALFCASNCLGKLGETPGQIQTRYGKPLYQDTSEGNPASHYKFGDFDVTVVFLDAKSASESLYPIAEDRQIDDAECEALIKTLSGTNAWKKLSRTKIFETTWASGTAFFARRTEDTLKTKDLVVVTAALLQATNTTRPKMPAPSVSLFGSPDGKNVSANRTDADPTNAPAERSRSANAEARVSMDDTLFKFHQDHAHSESARIPLQPGGSRPADEASLEQTNQTKLPFQVMTDRQNGK